MKLNQALFCFLRFFFLLKNERNVEEDWLVVDNIMETLMISTEEKNPTCKNERVL